MYVNLSLTLVDVKLVDIEIVIHICYLTMADKSRATISKQKNVAQRPIQSLIVR